LRREESTLRGMITVVNYPGSGPTVRHILDILAQRRTIRRASCGTSNLNDRVAEGGTLLRNTSVPKGIQ